MTMVMRWDAVGGGNRGSNDLPCRDGAVLLACLGDLEAPRAAVAAGMVTGDDV